MAFKTYRRNEEIKKLVIGYTLCFLEWYGNLGLYSKTLLPFDLNGAWELYLVDPNPRRLVEQLQQFFDELEE